MSQSPYPSTHQLKTLPLRGLAWEIIVVDDASPDGTQEIAKQLATVYGQDKVVRYYLSTRCTLLIILARFSNLARESLA